MTNPVSGQGNPSGFTAAEKEIIGTDPQAGMRLWTVDNEQDSVLLYSKSADLPAAEIRTKEFDVLVNRMYATVTDPGNPGVGIAAPQVGILRRIVLVQRFDKEGEPFGVYVNPRIVEYSEDSRVGSEGCLSIPGRNGSVMRAAVIKITYTDLETLEEVEETVEGFTAVIFQHEIDHLDGILYTDRMQENIVKTFSYEPRGVCPNEINIVTENGLIAAVEFSGGCSGNSKGLISLLIGMDPDEAIDRLEGITCGSKGTSCPDQLAKALRLMLMSE